MDLRRHRRQVRRLAGFLVLLLTTFAWADLPVAPRVVNPQTGAEAWNVIRLATANAERLLHEDRISELAGQVSLCSPALRLLARSAVAPDDRPTLDALTFRAFGQVNDVAVHGTAGLADAAAPAFAALLATLNELKPLFPAADVAAEIFVCPKHPNSLTSRPGATCPVCQGRMRIRRIPYTQLPDPSTPATTQLRIQDRQPQLLDADGNLLTEDRLLPIHGAPLRFILIEATFSDFHIIPTDPTAFSFAPRLPGPYRLWAELMPEDTALPEYPWTDWDGPFAPAPAPDPGRLTTADGFQFELVLPAPLRARQTGLLRIQVRDAASGTEVRHLEPFEEAFAHLTAFAEDGKIAFRLHPVGGDVLRPDLRGGPWLAFKMYPPAPGRLRLFCQVRIDGRPITAPLSVEVQPAQTGGP